jgi:hypothetical protein
VVSYLEGMASGLLLWGGRNIGGVPIGQCPWVLLKLAFVPLVWVTKPVFVGALNVEFDTPLVVGLSGSSSLDGTGGGEEFPLDGVPPAFVLCRARTLAASLGYFQASIGTGPSNMIPWSGMFECLNNFIPSQRSISWYL